MNIIEVKNLSKNYKYKVKNEKKGFLYNLFNEKEKVVKAKDIDSVVTGMTHGHPVRAIRNQMTKEYIRLEKEGADFMELEKLTLDASVLEHTTGPVTVELEVL